MFKRSLALLFLVLTSALCGADETAKISVQELVKTSIVWNGDALPNYPTGSPQVTLLKITIPPQTRLPWHKHPVINVGYLLAGELKVTAEDGQTLTLRAGDPIVELVDQWHYGENTGDEPAVILVFYAGEKDAPVTVLRTEDD